MAPIVSWLMPAYECESTIERALDSMLHQTFQDFEVVIVIDPPSMRTIELCRNRARRDNRIHLIVNETRLGIAKSLNCGLKICRGKYVARMDADDISHLERLTKQVAYMESHPNIDILGTNVKIIDTRMDPTNPIIRKQYEYDVPDTETIRTRLLFTTCLIHPSIVFRRDSIKDGYPDSLVEDYALFSHYLTTVNMAVLPETLVDYSLHEQNTCSARFYEIRKCGAQISRHTIERELGIDTIPYNDGLFGWRYYDSMPSDAEDFLRQSLSLLYAIWSANEKKHRFPQDVLFKTLNDEWNLSLWIVRPYNEIKEFFPPFNKINIDDIKNVFFSLDFRVGCTDNVCVYGIGEYANHLMKENPSVLNKVDCFVDSDERKWGRSIYNKKIFPPTYLANKHINILIAAPKFADEIYSQLQGRGISSECILKDIEIEKKIIDFHCRTRSRKAKYNERGQQSPRVYLFCAPDYGNLGDHAIAEAEVRLFKDDFDIDLIEVPCMEFRAAISDVKNIIVPQDLIVITGGGFLGSLWIETELQVRDIVTMFPDNNIVIMPQTIYWEDDSRWQVRCESTRKIYARHRNNLILFARDSMSKHVMTNIYPECKILLAPDMVLSQKWDGYYSKGVNRRYALICLKSDKESILREQDKQLIDDISRYLCGEVIHSSTNLTGCFSPEERKSLLSKKLNEFAQARIVITDRLHGVIFSIITGTPCIALDNCSHKVKNTFEWFSSIENIKFANDLSEIQSLGKQVIDMENFGVDICRNKWNIYFNELRRILSELL